MRDYSLVLGLDEPDAEQSLALWKALGDSVDGLKVGVPLLLANGVGLIGRLKAACDRPVIADLKVADIGFAGEDGEWAGTNRKIVETAVGAGADWVICQSIVGTSSIRECVDVAHASGGKVLTLPYMTHRGAAVFFDEPLRLASATDLLDSNGEGKVARRLEELGRRKAKEKGWRTNEVTPSDVIILLGEECGVDGYIGPANSAEVLEYYRRLTDKWVFATGVGRQGGTVEQVYRILGPKSAAIAATAIYSADDPIAVCRSYAAARDRARGPG